MDIAGTIFRDDAPAAQAEYTPEMLQAARERLHQIIQQRSKDNGNDSDNRGTGHAG